MTGVSHLYLYRCLCFWDIIPHWRRWPTESEIPLQIRSVRPSPTSECFLPCHKNMTRMQDSVPWWLTSNPAAIVDANHSNSNKQFKEQIRIVSEVLHSRNYNTKLKELIKGVMIESYLEEGCQSIGADQIYGKSITDPCLGWEDTERLIYKIAGVT